MQERIETVTSRTPVHALARDPQAAGAAVSAQDLVGEIDRSVLLGPSPLGGAEHIVGGIGRSIGSQACQSASNTHRHEVEYVPRRLSS